MGIINDMVAKLHHRPSDVARRECAEGGGRKSRRRDPSGIDDALVEDSRRAHRRQHGRSRSRRRHRRTEDMSAVTAGMQQMMMGQWMLQQQMLQHGMAAMSWGAGSNRMAGRRART